MDFLRCPHTRQPLVPAAPALAAELAARRETLRNHAGEVPAEFSGGMLAGTAEAGWFYPVRETIPVLLPGEGIQLPVGRG